MNRIYRLLIFIIVLVSFYSCKKEFRERDKVRLNRSAAIFNDSLLVCSTLNDSVIVENVKNKKVIFNKKINDTEAIRPQPVLDKHNCIYGVFLENQLSCIDVKTNNIKWIYRAKQKINAIKWINSSIVIISIREFGVVAINATTGKIIYELLDKNSSSCPTTFVVNFIYDKECIYVTDFQCSTISAFNLLTGEKIWSYGFDNYGPCKALIFEDFIFCGTTGGPNNDGRIFFLNKKTGKLIYEDNTHQFDITTVPLLYQDKIVYCTYDNKLMIFDVGIKESKMLYQFNSKNGLCGSPIYLVNDNIFFSDCRGDISRLNLQTKKIDKLGKARKGLNEVYLCKNQVHFVY